jgi:hypothetical protein
MARFTRCACSPCSQHTPENLTETRFTGGISPPGGGLPAFLLTSQPWV